MFTACLKMVMGKHTGLSLSNRVIKITKKKIKFKLDGDKINTLTISVYDYRLEIYNVNIRIIIGDKHLKKYADFNNQGTIYGMCSDWLKYNSSIVLLFNSNCINNMGLIAHECVHASNRILYDIGQIDTTTNDEVSAYLTQHLFNVVLKAKKINKRSDK